LGTREQSAKKRLQAATTGIRVRQTNKRNTLLKIRSRTK
jgi:hypothetical protein